MKRLFWLLLFVPMVLGMVGCGASSYSASKTPATPPPPPTVGVVEISAVSPSSVAAGSADLTLSITGKNLDLKHDGPYNTNTVVCWCGASGNGPALAHIIVSSSLITATVPASLLANPTTALLSIQKWYFADDVPFAVSNSVQFTVVAAAANAQAIVPSGETLGPRGTRQFQFVSHGGVAEAQWEIQEGVDGGQISTAGLYTAPNHTGTFHILATAKDGSEKTATASVTVVDSGFTATGSMHVARSGHTATLLSDGRVLILGGDEEGRAEVFDPTTGAFSLTGKLRTARFGATASLLASGKVLIVGGLGTDTEPGTGMLVRLNTAELYDPQNGVFVATGSMISPRVWHTATLLEDGRVLIAGGADRSVGGGMATASAEVYDSGTGKFTAAGLMTSARAKHTATLLPSGEVLIAGGFNGAVTDAADDPPWDPLSSDLFSTSNDTFRTSASMSTTRIGHNAVRLGDGKALVMGGIPKPQNVHMLLFPAYAESYDPVAGIFAPATNLVLSKAAYTATTLKNGLVLITGGATAEVAVESSAVFNPDDGTLKATGSLGTARTRHTATLLKDGRVLVTGGIGVNGEALVTAEIYR